MVNLVARVLPGKDLSGNFDAMTTRKLVSLVGNANAAIENSGGVRTHLGRVMPETDKVLALAEHFEAYVQSMRSDAMKVLDQTSVEDTLQSTLLDPAKVAASVADDGNLVLGQEALNAVINMNFAEESSKIDDIIGIGEILGKKGEERFKGFQGLAKALSSYRAACQRKALGKEIRAEPSAEASLAYFEATA
eukprot:692664-Alexandrium_andersonii.AAC.1